MLVFVTNFHQSFVTKIDRAYNVRCFYAQADKIVHSELEVSQIHTEEVAHSAMLMPHCEYSVHRKTIDGDLVRYVNVGDPIVHKWECDNPNYGMLVKNCEIKDGTGFTKQVLDEKGCPTYSHDIFGQPKYDSELKRAYVPTFAYKLPDVSQLFFECQIQVCNKRENECDGITPPNCPSVALPEFGHNSFVKPNIDPTQVIGTFDHVAFQPSFIPSLKPDVDSRQDNRITSNIAFPSRDALSNEIPVDRSYPRFYPERTVILQAHQQPYFRRKDSPTPTETNDILGNNLADDWSFWRNSTPLILKRSSRSTTSATRTYTNEKLNNRIRRAEDETMDVMSPLMVLDKDVDIGEFYKDDIIVDVKASNLSKSKAICLDKTSMGIIIGCFAFLSTCSLAMTTYIVYDICIKRKKHRKGIITRRSPSDCTDTESLESAGSRKSNPPSNRNFLSGECRLGQPLFMYGY
uniref:ZP domain-containing protein n=1 Tax=Acrobeloides nanus TaxID=290746 RepID=A0A914CEJ3_9BILA